MKVVTFRKLISTVALSGLMLTAFGAQAKENPQAGYRGGFFLRSPGGSYLLKMGGRLQSRIDYGDTEADKISFGIPRARLKVSGNAIKKDYTYYAQIDYGKGTAMLKDFYTNFAFEKGKLQVRVGQMKPFYLRQAIMSSSNLELVDRAVTNGIFTLDRVTGVMLHNGLDGEYEWSVGASDKGTFARLGYNWGKINGYSEPALSGESGVAVAANGYVDADYTNLKLNGYGWGADAIGKFEGVSVSASVAGGNAEVLKVTPAGIVAKEKREKVWEAQKVGGHVQASYTIDEKYQPAVRYAFLTDTEGNATSHEVTGGVSWYIRGHNLKLQADGGVKIVQDSEQAVVTTPFARAQLQFVF